MTSRGSSHRLLPRPSRGSGPGPATLSRRVSAGLAVVCLGLATLVAGGPAAASLAHHQASSAAARAGANDPSLVAGYVAQPADGLASASFRFKVPKVHCEADGVQRAVTLGLGDVLDPESPQVRAHASLNCPGDGTTEYSIAVKVCTVAPGAFPTKHGHRVSVTFAQSGGTVTATVTDEKTGVTSSATDSTANCDPPGDFGSILFGAFPVFAPTLLDLPTFHKVKPRDATLNGADLEGHRVHRQTAPGIKTTRLFQGLAGADPLSKRSGDAFDMQYRRVVHCC